MIGAHSKFLIFSFLIVSYGLANTVCNGFYSGPPKPIAERLAEYSKSKRGQSPLIIIDEFIAAEVEAIHSRYEEQTKLLQRAGVDSKLQSRLNVFDTTFSAAEKALKELDGLVSPAAPIVAAPNKKWFSVFSGGPRAVPSRNFESEIARFRICRSNMDRCSTELTEAIQETGKNLVQIDKLISDFESFSNQLAELRLAIEHQPDSMFFSMVIDRKIDSIGNKVKIMKENATLEKSRLLTAMVNIGEQAPVFKEQAELLLARIGEAIKDPEGKTEEVVVRENTPVDNPSAASNGLFHKLLALENNIDRFNLIRNLSNTHKGDYGKVFSAQEALEILAHFKTEERRVTIDTVDFVGANLLFYRVPVPGVDMRPFVASYLLRITRPSGNVAVDSELYALAVQLSLLGDLKKPFNPVFEKFTDNAESRVRRSFRNSFQPFFQGQR